MSDFEVYIEGTKIPMNEFVRGVIHDVLIALFNQLKNVELSSISRIDVS